MSNPTRTPHRFKAQRKAEAVALSPLRRPRIGGRCSDLVALLNTKLGCQADSRGADQRWAGHTLSQFDGMPKDLRDENWSLGAFLGGLQTMRHTNQPRRCESKPPTGKRMRPDPIEPDAERIED